MKCPATEIGGLIIFFELQAKEELIHALWVRETRRKGIVGN